MDKKEEQDSRANIFLGVIGRKHKDIVYLGGETIGKLCTP